MPIWRNQILLLRSSPNRQHSKVLYRRGSEEERQETRKSRSEEKVVDFISPFPFSSRKREAVNRAEPGGR